MNARWFTAKMINDRLRIELGIYGQLRRTTGGWIVSLTDYDVHVVGTTPTVDPVVPEKIRDVVLRVWREQNEADAREARALRDAIYDCA